MMMSMDFANNHCDCWYQNRLSTIVDRCRMLNEKKRTVQMAVFARLAVQNM